MIPAVIFLVAAVSTPAPDRAVDPVQAPAPKSKAVALALPMLGTVVPVFVGAAILYRSNDDLILPSIVIIATGLSFGPGLGHAYVGETARFVGLSLLRGAAFVLGTFVTGYGIYLAADGDEAPLAAAALLFGGSIVVTGFALAFRDFLDVHDAVDRHNTEVEAVVAPSVLRDRQGRPAPAAVLAVRF